MRPTGSVKNIFFKKQVLTQVRSLDEMVCTHSLCNIVWAGKERAATLEILM